MKFKLTSIAIVSMSFLLSACVSHPVVCANGATKQCLTYRGKLEAQLKKEKVTIANLPRHTLVLMPSDVLFDNATHDMTSSGEKILDTVSQYLMTYSHTQLKIRAYSDDILPYKARLALSKDQAREVAGYLWSRNIPMATQTMDYEGKGSKDPIASNQYYTGMAKNRRVIITITPFCCAKKRNK